MSKEQTRLLLNAFAFITFMVGIFGFLIAVESPWFFYPMVMALMLVVATIPFC